MSANNNHRVQDTEIIRDPFKPLEDDGTDAKTYIEVLSPSQILAYSPPPGMVLVGDQHIVRGNFTILGGPPGVGKSRASVALAVSGATKKDWLGHPAHCQFKTLIIQNENGKYRLRAELSEINCPELKFLRHGIFPFPPPLIYISGKRKIPEFQVFSV